MRYSISAQTPAIDVLMLDNFLRVVLLNSASLISIAEDPCRAEISISPNGVCCRASEATDGIGGLYVYLGFPVDDWARCCCTAEIITGCFLAFSFSGSAARLATWILDEVEFCGPDDLVFFDVPGSNKDDAEMMLDEDVGGRTSFTGVFTVRTGRHICSVLIIIGLLVALIFLGSIDDDAERMRDDDADVDNCTSFAGAFTLRTGRQIRSDLIITGLFACFALSGADDGDAERTRGEDADDCTSFAGAFT